MRNPKCPRSVEYCLLEAARRLLEIPQHERAMAACADLQNMLTEVDVAALLDGDLNDFVDDLQLGIGAVHEQLTESWFSPAQVQLAH